MVSLFLDSGAFSAWNKGVVIPIDEYIDFILENKHRIDYYSVLDVIGSPEKTLQNQLYMEKRGLSPIPCFHYGEPFSYLSRYIETHSYISLGGMVPISTKALILWLDTVFSKYICDSDGWPNVKVHGFGMTSFDLMFRYPWYSVDSTSWVLTGRFGSVFVPVQKNGGSVYDVPPWVISVSMKSPDITQQGRHFETLSLMEKKVIENYIHSKGFVMGLSTYKKVDNGYVLQEGERWFGKEEVDVQRSLYGTRSGYVTVGWKKDRIVETVIDDGLSNNYQRRDELNLTYFMDLVTMFKPYPWQFKLPHFSSGMVLL